MPYPNEHSCRLRDPGDFQDGSFRRISKGTPGQTEADGRPLSIIIGKLKGKTTTTAQAYRYPKSEWTEKEAKAHCADAGGEFHAAAGEKQKEGDMSEESPSLDQIRNAFYDLIKPGEMAVAKTSFYVKDVYTDHIIIEGNGKLYKVTFTMGDEGIEFGDMEEVRVEYVPVSKMKAMFDKLLGRAAKVGDVLKAVGQKFAGSPKNRFGTHSSYKFKGDYAAAWRCHFSKIGGGANTGGATGPIRGTVRRCEMIAAAMKPACNLPGTESIGARSGPGSPLDCSYPGSPSDYGLTRWDDPEDDKDREGMSLSCADLAVIKRAALAEIKFRAEKREEDGEKALPPNWMPIVDEDPLAAECKAIEGQFTGFKAFKQPDGSVRWVGWTTNAFRDLEGEIFATKALENCAAAAMGGDHGELWIGHIPAKIGTPDGHMVLGRFLVETGLFDDTADGKKAAEFYLAAEEPLEMSHRYLYDRKDREDGVYEWVRILERSVLPAGTAANAWTSFATLAKEAKEMPDEKTVAHFKKVLGEERYKELEGNTEALSKALERVGVDFKGLEPEGDEPKKARETAPAPVVPAVAADDVKAAFAAAQKDFDALGQKVQATDQKLQGIEKAMADLTAKVDALAKTDGEKIAQKVKEETPRAALWHASQAEETKVKPEEAQKLGGPKVPKVVQEIAAKVGG